MWFWVVVEYDDGDTINRIIGPFPTEKEAIGWMVENDFAGDGKHIAVELTPD